jgi:hypothetical protein
MYFEQKFDFFKTHKISYTGPLGTIDMEYGGHDTEIQNFGMFLPQTGNFRENGRLRPMDFEGKFEFF